MDISDEDIQQFLDGKEEDPIVAAAQRLVPVFEELLQTFDREEAFELVKDYWNFLLDCSDSDPVPVEDEDD